MIAVHFIQGIVTKSPLGIFPPSRPWLTNWAMRFPRLFQRHGPGVLRLIAAGKLLKAALLVALGIGALRLMNQDLERVGGEVIEILHLDPANQHINALMERFLKINPRHLGYLGIGSFIYAAVFIVEGVGLWLDKKWAEFMTVITTGLLLPVELYELVHHPTVVRSLVLAINAAIVAYLIYRLKYEYHRDRPSAYTSAGQMKDAH